ncbi:N-acetyltransferase [candidate division LCP-89 bacterium B3_LCP]|uniref:N-acetyltransferase n=1 Tax=candidate division LCP-89 bacterium B3_LCP TaxID=2012998 RepID=A0A532V381_UNCL8|nr:MAG: N-acetyltransferase [candidate division LCP-89 bacterium B3_LCP]
MSIQIEIIRKERHLKGFLNLPRHIYRGNPNWVPPLISDIKKTLHPQKNPFFQHAQMTRMIAKKNGKIAGRICAIHDHAHQDYWQEPVGFFGFFECIDDQEVADTLIAAAAEWLRQRGIKTMRGPMNPSTNDSCGVLIDSFDVPPVLMMPYNPPYYNTLIEKAGLAKVKDLYAYKISKDDIPERIIRIGDKIAERINVNIRPVIIKDFKNEIERIRSIYNQAWSKNWGFVPMTEAEFDHTAKDLKKIIDPQLAFIAEDEGQAVGFSLALPDLNIALKHLNGRLFPFGILKLLYYSRKINCARVITMGVVEGYRNRGIDILFYLESLRRAVANGYNWGELSWVLEDNDAMNKAIEMVGGKVYKRYRIYEMPL